MSATQHRHPLHFSADPPQGMDKTAPRFRPILPVTEYIPVIRGHPSPPRIPLIQIKPKRSPVTVACNDCRRKRIKCDGHRPTCSACLRANLACVFPLPEGQSLRDSQSRKLNQVTKAHDDLRAVLEMLREAHDEEDAVAILRLLRGTEKLDDAVQMVVDASVLAMVARTESRSSDETRHSSGDPSSVTSSQPTPSDEVTGGYRLVTAHRSDDSLYSLAEEDGQRPNGWD